MRKIRELLTIIKLNLQHYYPQPDWTQLAVTVIFTMSFFAVIWIVLSIFK